MHILQKLIVVLLRHCPMGSTWPLMIYAKQWMNSSATTARMFTMEKSITLLKGHRRSAANASFPSVSRSVLCHLGENFHSEWLKCTAPNIQYRSPVKTQAVPSRSGRFRNKYESQLLLHNHTPDIFQATRCLRRAAK